MFIYADESGHSGRYIFNEPAYYFQGAILSVTDPEPLLNPIAEKYRNELVVERIHANEIKPYIVERIGAAFLSLLKDTNWIFHLTVIEKSYLSVTKFVDTVFDSFENKGARWLWYNHQLFRHILCCLFDQVLSEQMKKAFWDAYLKDDYNGITSVAKLALKKLNELPIDARLYQVSKDGLTFALKYPEEITLMANRTKKSYKGHTPNMVAFSSMIQAVHSFCKEYNVVPQAFVHDPQSEFGSTMREYHTLLARLRLEHSKSGMLMDAESVDYNLGKFSLTPSKQLTSLQAVDVFLWLTQRNDRIKSEGLKQALWDRTEPFYISRDSSEMSARAWLFRLSTTELSPAQIKKGKAIIKKMEKAHFKKLKDFELKKIRDR